DGLRLLLDRVRGTVRSRTRGGDGGATQPREEGPRLVKTKLKFEPTLVCVPRVLPKDKWEAAARTAAGINPVNHPPVERLVRAVPGFAPSPAAIAVLTTKYWQSGGVKLGVKFLDGESTALKKRILEHMNAWAKTANVQFTLSNTNAKVRIARADSGPASGYWSYLGT